MATLEKSYSSLLLWVNLDVQRLKESLDKFYKIVYNEYIKTKEFSKMRRFRIEHKFTGSLSVIAGRDLKDAYKRCGKDSKYWKFVEEIF